jgi:hypothetical protein
MLYIFVISEWFVEAANYTVIEAPPNYSEFELAGNLLDNLL